MGVQGWLLLAGAVLGVGWVVWEGWEGWNRWADWRIEQANQEAYWAWEEEVDKWKEELSQEERADEFFAQWEAENNRGMKWMDW